MDVYIWLSDYCITVLYGRRSSIRKAIAFNAIYDVYYMYVLHH